MTTTKAKRPKWWRKGDDIVTAYGAHAAGPGWANSLVWCVVQGADGRLRKESLQHDEMSFPMAALLSVSAAISADMTAHARRLTGAR